MATLDAPPPVLSPSIPVDGIALDELLDIIDPLRHLRNQDDLDDHEDRHVVPTQPHSIQNERMQLTFPGRAPKEHASPLINITLKVDASPGCGGIAWPAGEVRVPRSLSAWYLNVWT